MKWFSVNSIHDVIRPLYYSLRFTGLCAVPLNSSSNSKYNCGPRAYVVLFIGLNFFFTYYSLSVNRMPMIFTSTIVLSSFDVYHFMYLVNAISSIVYLYIVRLDIITILEEQHQIDKALNKLKFQGDFLNHYIWLTITVFTVKITALILAMAYYWYFLVVIETGVYASWRQFIYLLFVYNYLLSMLYGTVMVVLPLQRFAALNQVFR